jgi:hypothetical protein
MTGMGEKSITIVRAVTADFYYSVNVFAEVDGNKANSSLLHAPYISRVYINVCF